MQLQQLLVALLLGLIVVLGTSTALYIVTQDTGSGIDDTSKSLGTQLDCVLSNKDQAREKCKEAGVEDTSTQYRRDTYEV